MHKVHHKFPERPVEGTLQTETRIPIDRSATDTVNKHDNVSSSAPVLVEDVPRDQSAANTPELVRYVSQAHSSTNTPKQVQDVPQDQSAANTLN